MFERILAGWLLVIPAIGCSSRSSGASAPSTDAATGWTTPDGIPLFQLYDLGIDPGSETYGLHVDQQAVFWIQRDRGIYRGSRDGRRPPERWAVLTGVYADTMASDDQRLYWLDVGNALRFKDRITGAEGKVTLSWEHSALAVDANFVYAGMVGCPAITRIDKQTLVAEEKLIPDVAVDPRGGGTTLLHHSGALFCGSWSQVFRVDDWTAPARKLADSAFRLWALAAIDDSLYWLNSPGYNYHNIYTYVSRLAVATGAVTDFAEERIGRGASNFITAPDNGWLFFTADSMMWAFSTREHRYVVAVPPDSTRRRLVFYGRNLATDGEALYYLAHRDAGGGRMNGVHKVPFSWLLNRLK